MKLYNEVWKYFKKRTMNERTNRFTALTFGNIWVVVHDPVYGKCYQCRKVSKYNSKKSKRIDQNSWKRRITRERVGEVLGISSY